MCLHTIYVYNICNDCIYSIHINVCEYGLNNICLYIYLQWVCLCVFFLLIYTWYKFVCTPLPPLFLSILSINGLSLALALAGDISIEICVLPDKAKANVLSRLCFQFWIGLTGHWPFELFVLVRSITGQCVALSESGSASCSIT